jgi:hypothetical protein
MRQTSVRQLGKLVSMDQELIPEIKGYIGACAREIDDLENSPRFGGDEEAQRLWLGRTDAEEIAKWRRQIELAASSIGHIKARR